VFFCRAVQPHKRCVANGFGNVIEYSAHIMITGLVRKR
jgi:hypothetical protein